MAEVVKFLSPEQRQERLSEMAEELAKANPTLTDAELVEKMVDLIKADPQARQGALALGAKAMIDEISSDH